MRLGRRPGRGVTCRARRDAAPSPAARLPTPSSSLPTPVLPESEHPYPLQPRGSPSPPGRSAVVQPPGTQPAPVTDPPGDPKSHRRPLLRRAPSSRLAAQPQGGVCPRRVAAAPGAGARTQAQEHPAAPTPRGLPAAPGPAASYAVPTRPTPTKPHRRKERKKKIPNQPPRNFASARATGTNPTTYPDVGELSRSFFGGISRRNRAKAPDFPC